MKSASCLCVCMVWLMFDIVTKAKKITVHTTSIYSGFNQRPERYERTGKKLYLAGKDVYTVVIKSVSRNSSHWLDWYQMPSTEHAEP